MKTLLLVALLTITHGYYDYRVDPLPHSMPPVIKAQPQVDYRPLAKKYNQVYKDLYTLRWHRKYGTPQTKRAATARAWRSLIQFNKARLREARSRVK